MVEYSEDYWRNRGYIDGKEGRWDRLSRRLTQTFMQHIKQDMTLEGEPLSGK